MGKIDKDKGVLIWISLLIIVPLYVAIIVAIYSHDHKRRDLTHIAFAILVGLLISVLLTVEGEWYPLPYVMSSTSFKNMSVSVQRISPFTIPISSLIYPANYSNKLLNVTIYNYTSIEPVSVSMSTPSKAIFDYNGFQNKAGYDPRTKSFGYSTSVATRHSGQVFNSTDEYIINVDYRNRNMSSPQNNTGVQNNTAIAKSSPAKSPITKNSISNLIAVNITNITASVPLNRYNTIDNNLTTSWSADGDGQSITYTFDKSYNVSEVGIAFYKGNVTKNFFEINQQQFNSSGKTTELENFTLKVPITTKSLLIIGHGNSGGGNSKSAFNEFAEVKVYGNGSLISPKIVSPPPKLKLDNTIYHNSVPFQWTVRMTDLSLATYFWIVMAGVVTSRFMSLILDKTERGKDDKDFQIIGWKDGLGILFSFIIALILFSSFQQQVSSLTTMVLFNISIAFAFGFGFDKTLEVAPRFSPRYRANRPPPDEDMTTNNAGSGTTGKAGGSGTTGKAGGSGTTTETRKPTKNR